MFEYTEELKVYGVSANDYIGTSLAITGTGVDKAVTDSDVVTYFENNRYSSKPNVDYTTPGHGKLTPADLSSVLKIKTYPDVDTMKSAILSDSYLATINAHAVHADYCLTSENALQIKLYFNTEANRNAWLNAVKYRSSGQFKLNGVTIKTS